MKDERLVSMANEIAAFFASEEPASAAENIANHLRRYWDPRMRAQIAAFVQAGGSGLTPAARAGVERLGP